MLYPNAPSSLGVHSLLVLHSSTLSTTATTPGEQNSEVARPYARMLFALIITMLLGPFRACEGSWTFQEEYRGSYVPEVIEAWHGPQIVAPDTPYVAAAGTDKLYFIDSRLDPKTAAHIKEQIERATVPKPDEYISIDELSATAEVKNSGTGETTFVFDPAYARVLFARGINKRNPDIKLPEHAPAGDWEVQYDVGSILANGVGS